MLYPQTLGGPRVRARPDGASVSAALGVPVLGPVVNATGQKVAALNPASYKTAPCAQSGNVGKVQET